MGKSGRLHARSDASWLRQDAATNGSASASSVKSEGSPVKISLDTSWRQDMQGQPGIQAINDMPLQQYKRNGSSSLVSQMLAKLAKKGSSGSSEKDKKHAAAAGNSNGNHRRNSMSVAPATRSTLTRANTAPSVVPAAIAAAMEEQQLLGALPVPKRRMSILQRLRSVARPSSTNLSQPDRGVTVTLHSNPSDASTAASATGDHVNGSLRAPISVRGPCTPRGPWTPRGNSVQPPEGALSPAKMQLHASATAASFSRRMARSFKSHFRTSTLNGDDTAMHDSIMDTASITDPQEDLPRQHVVVAGMLAQLQEAPSKSTAANVLVQMVALADFRWFPHKFWQIATPQDFHNLAASLTVDHMGAAVSATRLLGKLCRDPQCDCRMLGELGVIGLLVAVLYRCLGKDDESATAAACSCLQLLIKENPRNMQLVLQASMLPQLLRSMETGRGPCKQSIGTVIKLCAVLVQQNHTPLPTNIATMLVASLLAVITLNRNSKVVVDTLAVLGLLCLDDSHAQNAVRQNMGIDVLVKLVHDPSSVSGAASERATWTLMLAVLQNPANQAAVLSLTEGGTWARLLYRSLVLRLDQPGTRCSMTLGLLTALADSNPALCSLITRGGALPALVQLLQQVQNARMSGKGDVTLAEGILHLLQFLLQYHPGSRTRYLKLDGIRPLLEVIRAPDMPAASERALWCVAALANDADGRTAAREAGLLPSVLQHAMSRRVEGRAEGEDVEGAGGCSVGTAGCWALVQLMEDSPENVEVLRACGAVPGMAKSLLALLAEGTGAAAKVGPLALEGVLGVLGILTAPPLAPHHEAPFPDTQRLLPLLVELTEEDKPDDVIGPLSAQLLGHLCANNADAQTAASAAGAVPVLLGMLNSGGDEGRCAVACTALTALLQGNPLAADQQLARQLVTMLQAGAWMESTRYTVQLCTAMLAGPRAAELQGVFIEADMIEALLPLMNSGTSQPVTADALQCMAALALDCQAAAARIGQLGGMEILVRLIDSAPAWACCSAAATACAAAVTSEHSNLLLFLQYNGLPKMLALLTCGSAQSACVAAASALASIAAKQPSSLDVMVKIGVPAALLDMLEPGNDPSVLEAVLVCLTAMASTSPATAQLLSTVGPAKLLPLLDPGSGAPLEEGTAALVAACRLLAQLAHRNMRCKEATCAAGGVEVLCQLVAEASSLKLTTEAAFALGAVVEGHPDGQQRVCHAKGYGALLQVMAAGPNAAGWAATLCLLHCCQGFAPAADAVYVGSGVPVLVNLMLQASNEDTAELLLQLCTCLCTRHAGNSCALVDAGALPMVADVLQVQNARLQLWALNLLLAAAESSPQAVVQLRERRLLRLLLQSALHTMDKESAAKSLHLMALVVQDPKAARVTRRDQAFMYHVIDVMADGDSFDVQNAAIVVMSHLSPPRPSPTFPCLTPYTLRAARAALVGHADGRTAQAAAVVVARAALHHPDNFDSVENVSALSELAYGLSPSCTPACQAAALLELHRLRRHNLLSQGPWITFHNLFLPAAPLLMHPHNGQAFASLAAKGLLFLYTLCTCVQLPLQTQRQIENKAHSDLYTQQPISAPNNLANELAASAAMLADRAATLAAAGLQRSRSNVANGKIPTCQGSTVRTSGKTYVQGKQNMSVDVPAIAGVPPMLAYADEML